MWGSFKRFWKIVLFGLADWYSQPEWRRDRARMMRLLYGTLDDNAQSRGVFPRPYPPPKSLWQLMRKEARKLGRQNDRNSNHLCCD